MEIIYAIAEYLMVPNEFIIVRKVQDHMIDFEVKGIQYWAKLTRNDARLKKNSVRLAAY